jgi:hypothetical protein
MASRTLLALGLFAACSTSGSESHPKSCTAGKCDGEGVDQTCNDPRYADGVCQLDLSCSVPDIDCFETFDTDDAAAAWYATQESWVAAQKGKAQRTILPTTDPRYAAARALLDRGWEAFRTNRPVGNLGARRPALVLLDDPEPNAYVIPDPDKGLSALSVQVQTGLLSIDATDDERTGVMMHEMQHAVGLHLLGDTEAKITKHYVAANGEPIGREQTDDPAVAAAINGWIESTTAVGPFSAVELGGFPTAGQLLTVLEDVLVMGENQHADACNNAANLVFQLETDLQSAIDPLGGALPSDLSSFEPRVPQALAALRDECLAGFSQDFFDVLATLTGLTRDQVAMQTSAEDTALVTGKHVVDAIAALVADRRAKMRAFEQGLPNAASWHAARYFSFEEDADDTSVIVLRGAGMEPAAIGGFFTALLHSINPDLGDRCSALLSAKTVPAYGTDLSDPHHDTCWRAYHVGAFADVLAGQPAPDVNRPAPARVVRPLPTAPARLPLPRPIPID